MCKKYTKLKKIEVVKFRGLKNVTVEFGDRITLICGKNGTSKSTILGIVAQIFSFSTDYSENNPDTGSLKEYKTLFGKQFISNFSDHFRFSEKHDIPGSMDVNISLYDGMEDKEKNDLSLKLYNSQDRTLSRPVLRGNHDRNITNPVIYLSLNRLTPIPSREYKLYNDEYISRNKEYTLKLTNSILLQSNTNIQPTAGSLSSIAPHNNNYDYQSISVGEDNVGQIVKALLSFKRLKENFPNYSGGILLIDEVDAGLFPAAQIELFKNLQKFCKEHDVQVIMTSHSPSLIETVHSQKDIENYKINYITNTYGSIQIIPNLNWSDIDADIHVRTKVVDKELALTLPKIPVYCEDIEGREFFRALIKKRKLTNIIQISNTSLGGEQLKTLAKEKIPDFYNKGIVVLDADKKSDNILKNFCVLPGIFPPDQLLYDHLMKTPDNHDFWKNEIGFTKPVFLKIVDHTLCTLNLSVNPSNDLQEQIDTFKKNNPKHNGIVREQFKKFYKEDDIQKLFKKAAHNPFIKWKNENADLYDNFERDFVDKLTYVLTYGYRVRESSINEYLK